MSNLSIRGIDPDLSTTLKLQAQAKGKSVNQLVLEVLKEHAGYLKKKQFTQEYHDLDVLFGQWTESEFQIIQGKIDHESRIDEALWK
ncbi:MAG: antitoxin [Methylococcaceae bacterium]|nr:antitoxin [Methylococcaceae bacterium]